MKITDINIVEDKLVITLEFPSNGGNTDEEEVPFGRAIVSETTDINSIDKIYIDSIYNYDNIFSTDNGDHNFTITEFTKPNNTTIEITLDNEFDVSAFIVTINGVSAFYFDKQELYYKSVELLVNHCSTCLDKEQKERIMLLVLKKQLLEYAVNNSLLEDQVNYYKDIARMLKIDVISNKQNIINHKLSKCRTCCNRVCSLC